MYQTRTGEGHHAPHLPLCESSPSQALHCTHLESLREHLDDAGLRELLRDVRRMAHQKPQHTEGEGEGKGRAPSERGVRGGASVDQCAYINCPLPSPAPGQADAQRGRPRVTQHADEEDGERGVDERVGGGVVGAQRLKVAQHVDLVLEGGGRGDGAVDVCEEGLQVLVVGAQQVLRRRGGSGTRRWRA